MSIGRGEGSTRLAAPLETARPGARRCKDGPHIWLSHTLSQSELTASRRQEIRNAEDEAEFCELMQDLGRADPLALLDCFFPQMLSVREA